MKKKDLADIKNRTIEDLYKLIAEKEKQHSAALVEQKLGKLRNVHLASQLKKDLAQINTVASLKQIGGETKKETKENNKK